VTNGSAPLTVTVVGTTVSTAVDATGRFTLTNVPPGTVDLRFEGPATNAVLSLGSVPAGAQLDVTVAVSGTTAALVDHRAHLQGAVSALSGSCPTLQLTVSGSTVKTTAQTVYQSASCADLTQGAKVEVEGTRGADGVVVATKVQVERQEVDVRGNVSALGGACPTLTFTLNGTVIKTSSSTRFINVTCGEIRNGDNTEVEGVKQPDGSVAATKVDVDRQEVDAQGTVSALGGACPALTFSLSGTMVKTSATTKFEGLACAEIRNGDKAEVEGRKQPDGSIAASKVQIDRQQANVRGTIGALGGTCPVLTFTLNGTTVKTSSTTRFEGIACGDVRNGDQAEVEGIKQPDGTVTAGNVQVERQEKGVQGTIGSLGGTCPALTFTVGGTTVKTSSATRFAGVACAAIRSGDKAQVEGVKQADGSVAASKVEIEREQNGQ
jgi:hypothetical protein